MSFIHGLFIPSENNNYRARTLHSDFLSYYLIFALLISVSFKFISGNFNNVLGFATDISVSKLYELTNNQRTQNHLSTLHYNDALAQAAQKKAQDMFAKNYWAHFAPDGTTPWSFILSSGYQYEYAGENLAKNFLFSQNVVDAWMNSPSHRENILKSQYTDVGFAVVNGTLNGEQTTLVVQMFGKPEVPVVAKQQSPLNLPVIAQPALAKEEGSIVKSQAVSPQVNLLPVTYNSQKVFFVFLMLILLIDFFVAYRLNVFRVAGKNLAHIIFIGFALVGLLLLTRGAIL